jgi:hypothetical protein
MKTFYSLSRAIAFGLGVYLLTAVNVYAAVDNFHGNICQPQRPEQANRFDYTGVGINAFLSSGRVACPLTTRETQIKSVEVNVRETNLGATICSINGVDWNGNAPSVVTFSIPAGSKYKIASIPPDIKGTYFSYSVFCSLPKGQTLTSINVYTP